MQKKLSSFFFLIASLNFVNLGAARSAAGVLPYTLHNYVLLLLLGRESNGLSDFGGFVEEEETLLQAAVNEFSQETRYVFGKFALGLSLRKNHALQELERASKEYILPKLKMQVNHPKGTYTMYLACVDYIPADEFTFAHKTPDYDKEEYVWVSAIDLCDVMKTCHADNAYYLGMKIREEFVDELKTEEMHEAIKEIMKSKEIGNDAQ